MTIDEKSYLKKLKDKLDEYSNQVRSIGRDGGETAYNDMHKTVQKAVKEEDELRKKFEVGARFNVIRTQLQSVLKKFERELELLRPKKGNAKEEKSLKNKEIVYVYLFNAQGALLKTWENLLNTRALMEHSVNRPVYGDVEHVEAVLRARPVPEKHGFLAVAVNKEDVLKGVDATELKDSLDFPLLRLRQGSIQPENIQYFVHRGKHYHVSSAGVLSSVSAARGTIG